MNRYVSLLAILLLLPISRVAVGEDDGERGNEIATVVEGKPVSIYIALVEYLGGEGTEIQDVDSLAESETWIESLDDQKALLSLTRITVSTVNGEEGTTQFGERTAIESGRTRVAAPRGRGGFGGNPNDAGERQALAAAIAARNVAVSYQYEELGTLVRATPRVMGDGSIILKLQIERSAVSALRLPVDLDDEVAGQEPPPSIVRIMTESTLRLEDGKTRTAYRKSATSPHGLVETVVLVTASTPEAPDDGSRPGPAGESDPSQP